jgi:SAM-dependent methyltransferase
VNVVEKILETTVAYRLWQVPFAEAKLAPVLGNNDVTIVCRILDVGCGPDTNPRHFLSSDYLGLDLNEKYISYARRRSGRSFKVADVTALNFPDDEQFGFMSARATSVSSPARNTDLSGCLTF